MRSYFQLGTGEDSQGSTHIVVQQILRWRKVDVLSVAVVMLKSGEHNHSGKVGGESMCNLYKCLMFRPYPARNTFPVAARSHCLGCPLAFLYKFVNYSRL